MVGCRHSLWNPNDLICSNLKQASKSYTLVQPKQHRYPIEHFQRDWFTTSSKSYVSLHSSFAQIKKIAILPILSWVLAVRKCEIPNRSDRLFYPLILYGTTCLCKLPNRSDGLFYPLTLDSLFICYADYRIGQMDSFTLWHSTAYSDCETPNRSNDTQRLFCYAKQRIGQITLNGSFVISKGLGDDHRHGLYTTKVLADVWSTRLVGLIYRHYSNFLF